MLQEIHQALARLAPWHQRVFATCLVQRMLPNYAYFSKATGFGDHALLTNQLDLVWQVNYRMPIKVNPEGQLEKLEPNLPKAEEYPLFAVFPALDACSGLTSLLQSMQEKETQCGLEISRLSHAGVLAYLEYLQQQAPQETAIESDPLLIWELEMQQALVEGLTQQPESRATAEAMRQMVTEQRLSNLGIEY